MQPALSVMHCEQGRTRERTHTHAVTLSHSCRLFTHQSTLGCTCALRLSSALSGTRTFRISFSLLSHTDTHWTQQNRTRLTPGASRDSELISSDPAFTARLNALPAPPFLSTSLHSFIPHSPSCEAACVAEGHRAALCRGVAQCQESWRACFSVRD